MAKRAELEKRIARAGQREDEWALRGGDRREGSVLGAAGRSRSRSRGSRVESPEGRRSRLPTLPEGWIARRKHPGMRSKSRSRSRSRRVVMRSPERGAKKRTSRERSPPRRSPARRVSLRRTSSGRSSPSRASPAWLSPRASPERGSSRRARSRERARSKERKERDQSSRRISGEIAILKKQVEAQEKQRKPWNKIAHQKQDEVLKKVKTVLVTDLALAWTRTLAVAQTSRRTSSLSSQQVRRCWRRGAGS